MEATEMQKALNELLNYKNPNGTNTIPYKVLKNSRLNLIVAKQLTKNTGEK